MDSEMFHLLPKVRSREATLCRTTFAALRTSIKSILQHPHNYPWTVQGFGMLRTYLGGGPKGKRYRLNVWNSDLAVPNVSIIHDHPWDFDSWIINGEFHNVRYLEDYNNGDLAKFMLIRSGVDGAPASTMATIRLRALPTEHYHTGDTYHQDKDEIHASYYDDGTVTLNDRVGDTEHARVFWFGNDWVDAKPREATKDEINQGIGFALSKWETKGW